ncbi:MAG TPA: sporulation protein YunB [Candidatus Scatomorpha gallistercoris]|nr:sporulation protein YunB [Candidatus Scatomorpha gallistercoris]
MPRRIRRRPMYIDVHLPRMSRKGKLLVIITVVLAILAAVTIKSIAYFRELSRQMVLSDATDLMTLCINDTISRKFAEEDYDYDYFVNLEYGADGSVTAVQTNMARINALSSELLSDIVHAADGGQLSLSIPVGNVLGSSLLLGKGPEIPVDITMLTSSHVDFKNELSDAGINQTKHQIKLDVVVDIDVIMPWQTISTQVVSEILIAETVILGDVPDTYLNWGSTA